MSMFTKDQLLADGCVKNPYIYLSDGWIYCPGCRAYTFHDGFSHRGLADAYEVCQVCGEYHGQLRLKGRTA